MIVLGFDTSVGHCAAALYQDGVILAEHREDMTRGQAERIMVLLEDMLTSTGLRWRDIDVIGVGVGPGNFTGIRISVSAARGLALALGVPAIGIDRFDVIEATAEQTGVPCVAATQDNLYIREAGKPPELVSAAHADALPSALLFDQEDSNPAILIAQIAATRAGRDWPRPAPLYIKAADAAPARDTPPEIVP